MKKYSDNKKLKWLNNLIFKEKSDLDCQYLRDNFSSLSSAIDFFIDVTKRGCNCDIHDNQVCDVCQNVVGKKLKDIR